MSVQTGYFCRTRFNRPGIQAVDGRRSDMRELNRRCLDVRRADSRVLDVCVADGSFLDLKLANSALLKLSDAHGAQGQLAAGDNTGGKLPGGDKACTHGILHGAQCHLLILTRQGVVGIGGHPHGHFHADALCDYPDCIPQEDALQEAVLPVFLGLRHVNELHGHCDSGKVATLVELSLRCFSHLRVAGSFRLLLFPLGDLLAVGHRKMNPLRRGITGDVRTVDVDLRQVQHLAVLVLAGRHDACDHIAHVHVVFDAGQVLALTDLDVGVAAHALYHKHVEPVPLQFAGILRHNALIAEQDVHGILVLVEHLLGGGGQVGIEGEVMLGETYR